MRFPVSKSLIVAVAVVLGTPPALAGKANDTLVWTTPQDINAADPYYAMVREQIITYRHLCDNLLYADPETGKFLPLLAKEVKWIDPLTLEADLRDDVAFHNGKKFKAEDVVYTLNHVSADNSGVVARRFVEWIKSAEALGDYKVRIHLKDPFPAAFSFLSGPLPILPKGHYDNAPVRGGKKDYGAVPPVCTGPYKLASITPGKSVELVKNEQYFGNLKQPKVGKVVFRTIPDPETQVAELLTGGVNWMWGLEKDKAEKLRAMGQVQVVQAPILRVSFLQMDAKGKKGKSPFQDIRVRRAVNHAINKAAIAKNVVGEAAVVVDSACNPSQTGCSTDVPKYDYNPAKAKKLLAEAGYPNGFTVDIWSYRQRPYTEAVMGDLAKVGIKTNLKYVQYKVIRQATRDGSAQFSHLSWGSFGVNDISAMTSYFFEGNSDDLAQDPQVIEWLKAGDTEIDPKKRNALYHKALSRIADQAYWVPLFTYAKYYAFSKDLTFRPDFDEIVRFWTAEWK